MAGGVGRQPLEAHVGAWYSITADGVVLASFSELVELSSEFDCSEHGRGEEREAVADERRGKRLPAIVKLTRAQSDDLAVFKWHREGVRRDVVLAIYAIDGTPLEKYFLGSVCPTKLETSAREVGGTTGVLHETVTLTCEDIQRVSP